MTRHYCDRCGAALQPCKHLMRRVLSGFGKELGGDFCDNCYSGITALREQYVASVLAYIAPITSLTKPQEPTP